MSLASFDRLMERLYGSDGYTKGIDVELGLIHAFPDFMRDGWNVIKAGDLKEAVDSGKTFIVYRHYYVDFGILVRKGDNVFCATTDALIRTRDHNHERLWKRIGYEFKKARRTFNVRELGYITRDEFVGVYKYLDNEESEFIFQVIEEVIDEYVNSHDEHSVSKLQILGADGELFQEMCNAGWKCLPVREPIYFSSFRNDTVLISKNHDIFYIYFIRPHKVTYCAVSEVTMRDVTQEWLHAKSNERLEDCNCADLTESLEISGLFKLFEQKLSSSADNLRIIDDLGVVLYKRLSPAVLDALYYHFLGRLGLGNEKEK